MTRAGRRMGVAMPPRRKRHLGPLWAREGALGSPPTSTACLCKLYVGQTPKAVIFNLELRCAATSTVPLKCWLGQPRMPTLWANRGVTVSKQRE